MVSQAIRVTVSKEWTDFSSLTQSVYLGALRNTAARRQQQQTNTDAAWHGGMNSASADVTAALLALAARQGFDSAALQLLHAWPHLHLTSPTLRALAAVSADRDAVVHAAGIASGRGELCACAEELLNLYYAYTGRQEAIHVCLALPLAHLYIQLQQQQQQQQ
jgi:hypothetical protein